MATSKQLNERDTKLVQWLNEAHAKESELVTDLAAHIALTQKASYKKRLQAHLKETRAHKREVAKQIKSLGGGPVAGAGGVPSAISQTGGKAVAAVKGQLGAARALVTEQAETHLRNAQEELREEHIEIALYTRIETFADAVGDGDTARLAKRLRRDEERMARYLSAEMQRLVKELVKAEVPSHQRAKPSRAKAAAKASTSGTRTAGKRTKSSSTS